METLQKKTVYNAFDVGKFLCAFLILFYHYFSERGALPGVLNEALSLYAVAVALFMAISGFLLYSKLETVQTFAERWKIVKKQVVRIYTVYLIWSVPYLLFTILRWDWSSISVSFLFWQVQEWVFSSTFYTIWFMPMLALGLLLSFFVTEKLPKVLRFVLCAVCCGIGALMLTYRFVGDKIPAFGVFAEFADTWLGGGRGWLFYAFPLVMVGRLAIKLKDRVKPVPMAVLSVLCLGAMLAEALIIRRLAHRHTGIDLAIFMIPTVFCVLGFLISLRLPDGKCYVWMRNMSTLIFMSQRLFLTVLPRCFPGIFTTVFKNQYIGALVITALEVVSCALIICLSKKWKALKRLF